MTLKTRYHRPRKLVGHTANPFNTDVTPETPIMSDTLTIGQLSQLTGVGTHTLRVWEKRYDALRVVRLPSGHRRYPQSEVVRLRAIVQALDKGFRTRHVVNCNLEDLKQMLRSKEASGPNGNDDPSTVVDSIAPSDVKMIQDWVSAAKHFDENELTHCFHKEWGIRGPLVFLQSCAIPFIVTVGHCWAEGSLSVAQEHFASEHLYDFLGAQWRKLNERNSGRPFLLTTLPGEPHRVGIQMCALVTAISGRRVVYLGQDTPLEDMVATVAKTGAETLCLSVSVSYPQPKGKKLLTELRKILPEKVTLVVGGQGGDTEQEGITPFSNLEDYFLWVLGKGS